MTGLRTCVRLRCVGISLAMLMCTAPAALGQDAGPLTGAPPTLDELLGLDERGRPVDRARDLDELIEKLVGGGATGPASSEDIEALFLEAVAHMRESRELLQQFFDAGLTTQRQQEEALRKLDMLIATASQQQSQSAPSTSSSAPRQDPGQQQQQQPGNNEPGTGENQGRDNRPGLRETELSGSLDEMGAEWGSLAPRVRDLLRQGRVEASARLYRRLTDLYYQKLAEEAQP